MIEHDRKLTDPLPDSCPCPRHEQPAPPGLKLPPGAGVTDGATARMGNNVFRDVDGR